MLGFESDRSSEISRPRMCVALYVDRLKLTDYSNIVRCISLCIWLAFFWLVRVLLLEVIWIRLFRAE